MVTEELSRRRVLEILGMGQSPGKPVTAPNDTVDANNTTPYPPDVDDLSRLYRLARSRRCITILELGSGYSTAILAAALEENRLEMQTDSRFATLRRNNPFELHTVDASADWLKTTMSRIPDWCRARVFLHHSGVSIGTFADRIVHYYDKLPNICPDFIYLDGPSQHDVTGEIGGVAFNHNDRTVIAADIARMEWLLLPGTLVLCDGRTNNARFLKRNFQREWRHVHDEAGDVHTFELVEPPLGALNRRQLEFCLGGSVLPIAP